MRNWWKHENLLNYTVYRMINLEICGCHNLCNFMLMLINKRRYIKKLTTILIFKVRHNIVQYTYTPYKSYTNNENLKHSISS